MLFGTKDLLVFVETWRDDVLSMGAVLVRPTFVRSGCCPAHICDADGKTTKIEVCPLTLKIAGCRTVHRIRSIFAGIPAKIGQLSGP